MSYQDAVREFDSIVNLLKSTDSLPESYLKIIHALRRRLQDFAVIEQRFATQETKHEVA